MVNFWAYLTDEERQKEIIIRRERFTKNNPMKNPITREKSKQHANPWTRGKTYEEMYGENASKYRDIAREIGWKNKGKKRTPEQIEKIKRARLNQTFPFKDTTIEVALQKELNTANIKFDTHYPIVGQPDIVILENTEKPIAIFADGCYWHCCLVCFPNGNRHIYKIEHDKNITKTLVDKGYTVLRFWEHEIKKDVKKCIEKIISTTDLKR